MKKLFILLTFALLGMAVNAQVGTVKSFLIDTLDNVTPRTSAIVRVTSDYNAVTFQALSTQLGGTSDGKLVLYGSVDGLSYSAIVEKAGQFTGLPVADSAIVTNGGIWHVVVTDNAFKYYKVIGTGTASDTTYVTLKYILR